MSEFYSFSARDIHGETVSFEKYRGKKILIVNLASECGFTSQYKQLQELYENTNRSDFEILGFPSNDFGGQEPGSESEIQNFCKVNYGVSFPLFSKVSILGEQVHPLYQWLHAKNSNKVTVWNFQKYLIDEQGFFVNCLAPDVLPIDEKVLSWINTQ